MHFFVCLHMHTITKLYSSLSPTLSSCHVVSLFRVWTTVWESINYTVRTPGRVHKFTSSDGDGWMECQYVLLHEGSITVLYFGYK